jgi:hypothetical protein
VTKGTAAAANGRRPAWSAGDWSAAPNRPKSLLSVSPQGSRGAAEQGRAPARSPAKAETAEIHELRQLGVGDASDAQRRATTPRPGQSPTHFTRSTRAGSGPEPASHTLFGALGEKVRQQQPDKKEAPADLSWVTGFVPATRAHRWTELLAAASATPTVSEAQTTSKARGAERVPALALEMLHPSSSASVAARLRAPIGPSG